MTPERKWDDQTVEIMIGNLLRAGVLFSAAVVLFGAIIYLGRHGGTAADYHMFRGEPSDLRHFDGILAGVRGLHGRAIIQLGLIFLIATPVARVAFAVFGFYRENDRMYVVFTLIVLTVLCYSLFGS
jgi:uncharacterized membrane protein